MLYLCCRHKRSRRFFRLCGGEAEVSQTLIFPVCWNDRLISAEKRQGRGDSGSTGASGTTPPFPRLQAESPTPLQLSVPPPSLSSSSGSAPVLGSCIQFFLIALSGTPGNAIDCGKSSDCCLFELSGMHLNLNVFIS